jgi:hypothetical protein
VPYTSPNDPQRKEDPMWRFHWHWKDDEDHELTTTQTAVPTGEQIPLPPDVAGGTLTHVTLEPEPTIEAAGGPGWGTEAPDPTGLGDTAGNSETPQESSPLPSSTGSTTAPGSPPTSEPVPETPLPLA